uniref:Uncharacterized protein n=1 Tax=Romanomermis culicivorax TaxID=13658 RepID=A0A915KD66_ROMCU
MRLIVFILRSNNHSLIIWSLITAIVYLSAVLGSWLLLSKLELLEMKFGIRGDGGDIELENLDFNDNFLSIDDYEDHYDARSDDKNLLKNYKRVKFFEFARNMTFSILPKNFSCHNKSQAITRNDTVQQELSKNI